MSKPRIALNTIWQKKCYCVTNPHVWVGPFEVKASKAIYIILNVPYVCEEDKYCLVNYAEYH